MFEACIRITEKNMTWNELKTLCESKNMQIISLALLDNEGKTIPGSSIVATPDSRCALHFKTAEADLASEETEIVSESVGYIDSESREITKKWDRRSNEIIPKVSAVPENQIHGIIYGGQ